MDRITLVNAVKKLTKKLFFYFGALCMVSCSSSPMVASHVSISPVEKRRLLQATDRHSNNLLYASNLKHFTHPKKIQLYREARLLQSNYLEQNYTTLKMWYEGKLSKHEKQKLSKNCSTILTGFKTHFPMTETTLACAGWWLDERLEAQNKQKIVRKARSKRIFRLRAKDKYNWYKYRHLSLASSLHNMKTKQFKNLEHLANTALKTKYPCAYKNANFALVASLEDFLPKKEAYNYITKIYNKSSYCYKPNQTISERFHLRVGVIHLVHGNYILAKRALQKTQFERKPDYESRSLFWLGKIEAEKNNKPNNKYWKSLTQKNPIGFFSLVANSKLNHDPKEDFVSDKTIHVQNRVSGGWNEVNLQAFLFDLFYANRSQKALESLSLNVSKRDNSHKDLNLYWAVSHSIAKNDRYSIFKLANYFSGVKKPRFSQELVRLNFPLRYSKEILKRSKKVDPLLVLALIRQESAFDQYARSHANARGLMQLLPSTANTMSRRISAQKLYDPQTNINLGITYLEKLFERYNGRTEYVLAAYNAGPHRVDDWSERISTSPLLFMEYVPYKETRNYVSTIMRNYYWYKRITSDNSSDEDARKLLDRNMTAIWTPSRIIAHMK